MKKTVLGILFLVILASLYGCGETLQQTATLVPSVTATTAQQTDNAKRIKIINFSQEETEAAKNAFFDYFTQHFNGCTLLTIRYIGDDHNGSYRNFAVRKNATAVITFIISFYVDSSGGDGSLNTNFTYTGFDFIMVRNQAGNWEHADHGY